MAKLLRSLLCQRVITDRETNSVSYIDAVEGFGVPRLPYPFPPIFLGTLWQRETAHDKLLLRFRVESPDGTNLMAFEAPEYSFGKFTRHRYNLQFAGFEIHEAGEHVVVVEQLGNDAWQTVTRILVDVQLVEKEAPPPEGTPDT